MTIKPKAKTPSNADLNGVLMVVQPVDLGSKESEPFLLEWARGKQLSQLGRAIHQVGNRRICILDGFDGPEMVDNC